jgi:hypothetical protein
MNYGVFWLAPASTDLLAHLLRAADKPRTLATAREIDRRLQKNPGSAGEERPEGRRILFVRPFCVLYRIDDSARAVYVERVKWVGD